MAKDTPQASTKPSHTLDRKVRSPAGLARSTLAADQKSEKHRSVFNTKHHDAAEKSQLEFQRIFGVNIKAARLKSNLKQSDVATITGLTQQYLSLIEAGQQNVTLKTMALLAEVVEHHLLALLQEGLEAPSKKD